VAIHCDLPPPAEQLRELVPWLDPAFREYVLHGGYGGYALPTSPWERDPPWEGAPDLTGVEYGILTARRMLSVSAIPNRLLASAIATAHNRRLVEEWLPADERLRGSLLVAPQEPERASAEIRRVGGHPRIVQALVSLGAETGYGDRRYRPIWDACADVGLPLAMRVGAEGVGINAPPTASGYPATVLELRTLLPAVAMSHLVSIVAHRVLQRLPTCRVAIVGAGASWLPALLDRFDASWRLLREEDSLDGLPSEMVARSVRLTTGPPEDPPASAALAEILMLGGAAPTGQDWGPGVTSENARRFYELPAG
jgi:uncharacterized protein